VIPVPQVIPDQLGRRAMWDLRVTRDLLVTRVRQDHKAMSVKPAPPDPKETLAPLDPPDLRATLVPPVRQVPPDLLARRVPRDLKVTPVTLGL